MLSGRDPSGPARPPRGRARGGRAAPCAGQVRPSSPTSNGNGSRVVIHTILLGTGGTDRRVHAAARVRFRRRSGGRRWTPSSVESDAVFRLLLCLGVLLGAARRPGPRTEREGSLAACGAPAPEGPGSVGEGGARRGDAGPQDQTPAARGGGRGDADARGGRRALREGAAPRVEHGGERDARPRRDRLVRRCGSHLPPSRRRSADPRKRKRKMPPGRRRSSVARASRRCAGSSSSTDAPVASTSSTGPAAAATAASSCTTLSARASVACPACGREGRLPIPEGIIRGRIGTFHSPLYRANPRSAAGVRQRALVHGGPLARPPGAVRTLRRHQTR